MKLDLRHLFLIIIFFLLIGFIAMSLANVKPGMGMLLAKAKKMKAEYEKNQEINTHNKLKEEVSKNEASKNIDDYIQEVNEKFKLEGKHIHPKLMYTIFSNWYYEDEGKGPHTVPVDFLTANDSANEYSQDYTVEQGRLELSFGDNGFFFYKWLGKLKNGIHVLKTWGRGGEDYEGGSGVDVDLHFVEFEISSGSSVDGSQKIQNDGTYKRLLMTIIGHYVLGDRSSPEITVINDKNKVVIGPDDPERGTHVYRDKAVILEFDANKNMIMTGGDDSNRGLLWKSKWGWVRTAEQ